MTDEMMDLADCYEDCAILADPLGLDPEIAALCDAALLPVIGAHAAATKTMITWLYAGQVGLAYAAGWAPAHIEHWLVFVRAEIAAAQRRAQKATSASARRVRHFAISAGVKKPPKRTTLEQRVLAEGAKFGLHEVRS